ncbi:DUF4185 domain-containing protein [Micromonospora sp. R77]|uniref:DUF4185 domain-containing protein n=1 Tax=Micromonospora sp. R77 TaxID=2925836 RepID=UPI001F61D1C4|nr:DUF4185 domain-containing protein [Micromonospora sp. R77]MCI4064363.1 DUF4185 domain-containing protein [Micromonospora sp. R77]
MTLRLVEFVVAGNEASDLLPVRSAALLRAYRARRGFWTVLDEGPVERCLALLLELQDGEWVAHHVAADAGTENGRTEDGEALAHHDGWVYVFGSHFGSKGGPLRPRRAFVARFREDDAATGTLPLAVVRNRFRLHRAVNDALVAAPVTLLPPGDRVRHRFIVETLARGTARAKSWVSRLAEDDLPLNVEAASFTPAGTVLLGLRFPVTGAGEPIMVELAGVPEMFAAGTGSRRGPEPADPGWPRAVAVYALTGVTPPGELTGFRAITPTPDGGYAAVIGSIDALGKGSVLLDDHPAGGKVTSRHVRFRLDGAVDGRVGGELVADLAPFHHVEGLAELAGRFFYVTDEDHRVALWIG